MSFFTTPNKEELDVKSADDHKDLAGRNSTSSADSTYDAPPAYTDVVGGDAGSSSASPNAFPATSLLQIQAVGYDHNQALVGTSMEQISVYRAGSGELEYNSIRLKRTSNSCALVRGSDSKQTPLISTIYRWGPGRHPRMRILPSDTSASIEHAINSVSIECELIDVKSRSMLTRAQKFATSLGTFEWRYGSRDERKEDYDAASLLIMERTDAPSSVGGKKSKRGVRVAQLVRNDEFRTPGTTKWMGGNGGRLMIDLSMWMDDKKTNVKDVEAFVVASCICMLKRESDRFRDNTISTVT